MSYVKFGLVYKGNFSELEVHGSELMLSCRKRIEKELELVKEAYKDDPVYLKGIVKTYQKYLDDFSLHPSGIIRDRIKLGIDELENEEKIKKWVKYIRKMHIPDWGQNEKGYPLNSIIDFDQKIFYSRKRNWYADYSLYLPEGWRYQKLTIQEMKKLLKRFQMNHSSSKRKILRRKS